MLRSKWWAKKDNAAYLAGIEERILSVAAGLGDAAYRVHYDDYVADPAVLRGLFDWLGEEFDLATVPDDTGDSSLRSGERRQHTRDLREGQPLHLRSRAVRTPGLTAAAPS